MNTHYDNKIMLDPKNDIVFQRIFGNPKNEDILISFLNAILEKNEKEKIKNIEYIDTKLLDAEVVDDKIGILDLRVITENQIHINVEIQLINRYDMVQRTLFYWSRLYSSQIKRGGHYKKFNKTITINIVNFKYIKSKDYHTTYHLYEDEEKVMLSDIMEVHFVELPKFLDERPELTTSLSEWLTFLTTPEREVMEVVEMSNPEIKKAMEVLETLSRDPETVRLAELRMKKILDERSLIEGAREEAKAEGKMEEKKKIAKKALSKGTDVSFVMAITGLSEKEVLELKSKIENK